MIAAEVRNTIQTKPGTRKVWTWRDWIPDSPAEAADSERELTIEEIDARMTRIANVGNAFAAQRG